MYSFFDHVFDLLVRGGILAVVVMAVLTAAVLIWRRYTAKKAPDKLVPLKRLVPWILFFSYLAIVAAATILWRRGSGTGVNLHFLRAFFEARNSASVQGWINVILNVAMFVPIGLLLPAVNGVFRKWYVTLAAGAGMSLVIETTQVVLRRGTGDIDDLVTNTLGCTLGYCLFMMASSLRRRDMKGFAGSVVLPAAVVCVTAGVFVSDAARDYGFLAEMPSYTVNTRGIEWTVDFTPDNENDMAPVFSSDARTKRDAEEFAADMGERLGVAFGEANYYDGEIWYASRVEKEVGTTYFLRVRYPEESFEYTDAASRDRESGIVGEAELRERLAELGADVPDVAEFEDAGDGEYVFSCDMLRVGEDVFDGAVRCRVSDDKRVSRVWYGIRRMRLYSEDEVISEAEALELLKKGWFSCIGGYWRAFSRFGESVEITGVDFVYSCDTKGFYQPVYAFSLMVEAPEDGVADRVAMVPALK